MVKSSGPSGIWSLGMLLLGRLTFAGKAILISLIFAIPLSYTLFDIWNTRAASIDFTQKERVGVRHLQAFAPVLHGLIDARNATRAGLGGGISSSVADYTQARQRMEAGLGAFETLMKKDGDSLELSTQLAEFRKAFADTASSKDGTDGKGRTVFGPVTKAASELIIKIGDNSGLALDPDLDSFYLINGALFTMPKVIEDTGQLWGWGAFALAKPISVQQTKQYEVWASNVNAAVKDTLAHFKRVTSANPDLAKKINTSALQAADDFRLKVQDIDELVNKSVSPQAHYDEGKQRVQDVMALYTTVFTELDILLEKREMASASSLRFILISSIVLVVLALYLFMCFYKTTKQGIEIISTHLEQMSVGDLRHRPQEFWTKDEFGSLVQKLAVTYDSLYELIRKVRHGARELHTASNEIASASTDLAARTEASAAALEEQSSAMEEIAATVGTTAEHAQMAATFAGDNASVAEKGGAVISQVVTTMQEIHASSAKINDIIGVIDSIAFQTNILALNAAVEAARAGDAGRGFAVVASEVRNLAQRSASAAQEIKGLITTSVEKVESGTHIVEQAGQTMSQVVKNARQIDQYLGEIATSSREQASGVEQVGQSIQELDRSTQQNAALVEETTSAAASLREQAELLQSQIANFKVA